MLRVSATGPDAGVLAEVLIALRRAVDGGSEKTILASARYLCEALGLREVKDAAALLERWGAQTVAPVVSAMRAASEQLAIPGCPPATALRTKRRPRRERQRGLIPENWLPCETSVELLLAAARELGLDGAPGGKVAQQALDLVPEFRAEMRKAGVQRRRWGAPWRRWTERKLWGANP